jgi:hypothetical protein
MRIRSWKGKGVSPLAGFRYGTPNVDEPAFTHRKVLSVFAKVMKPMASMLLE